MKAELHRPWIVAINHGQGFQCEHCGGRELLKLPIPLRHYVKKAEAFVRQHKGCVVK